MPAFVVALLTAITVADAILLESSAPTNGVAVVPQCIAGAVGTLEDLGRVRKGLAFIEKGLYTLAGFSKKQFSPESVVLRLASPLFLAPTTAYLPFFTAAQQANANAARVNAEAALPGDG